MADSTAPSLAIGPVATKPRRIAAIDVARGLAVLAMIVFHFAWDLDNFALTDFNVFGSPGWRIFSRTIASSFLMLAGVGLVLGHTDGIRWPAFWQRFAIIASAAALVSLGTWYAFPHAFVYFGILHAIALGSLIALPALRLPAWAVAMLALAALALPFVDGIPRINGPAFWWIGLADDYRSAVDFIPLLPWIAPLLAGMALAKAFRPCLTGMTWKPQGRFSRTLALAGRFSLPIYLLHQPILLGMLWLGVQVFASPATMDEREFANGCVQTCVSAGTSRAICANACPCAASMLKREGLLMAAINNKLTPEQTQRMQGLAMQCLRDAVLPPQQSEPALPAPTAPSPTTP
jgi:uncharacterized membrane protein